MEDIFRKIYKIHSRCLKNKQAENKKLLICFSGIPGSGKTAIAKILEGKYKGVRVHSETIGKIIRKLNYKGNSHELQNKYQCWLIENLPFKNKLIILDSGIDRKYAQIAKFARKNNFKIFIIRIKVPRLMLIKRIKKRNKRKARIYLDELERWTEEFREFGKNHKPDIEILNDKSSELNEIFVKLDKIILNKFYNVRNK